MNRTDRLYAVVEELRAVAPRPRTARQIAERFEVSVRTIERDLTALLEAGVPIYATPGPGGGYALDPAHTLPPVNFTADEAAALAIALARPGSTPLADALRSALRKVVTAMPAAEAEAARRFAGRVHLMAHDSDVRPSPARAIERALVDGRVVAMAYEDRHGRATRRTVEPIALVGSGRGVVPGRALPAARRRPGLPARPHRGRRGHDRTGPRAGLRAGPGPPGRAAPPVASRVNSRPDATRRLHAWNSRQGVVAPACTVGA